MHSAFHFYYACLKRTIFWIFNLGPISICYNQSNFLKYQMNYEYPLHLCQKMLNGCMRIWMLWSSIMVIITNVKNISAYNYKNLRPWNFYKITSQLNCRKQSLTDSLFGQIPGNIGSELIGYWSKALEYEYVYSLH